MQAAGRCDPTANAACLIQSLLYEYVKCLCNPSVASRAPIKPHRWQSWGYSYTGVCARDIYSWSLQSGAFGTPLRLPFMK